MYNSISPIELLIIPLIIIFLLFPPALTLSNLCTLVTDIQRKAQKRIKEAQTDSAPESEEAAETPETSPKKKRRVKNPKRFRMTVDVLVFLCGSTFTLILWHLANFKEWHEQLYDIDPNALNVLGGGSYTPIHFGSMPTILTLACIAIVGFWALRLFYKKLPPIICALCFSSLFVGLALTAVWIIQLLAEFDNLFAYYFMLFPINYCLCAVRLVYACTESLCERIKATEYKNPLLNACKKFLSRAYGFILFSFVLALPLTVIIILILTLFGQTPDSAIKAFTETAEWSLSQKIPPPRLSYDGHYLCTVAACGDEKTVKPIRAGKRHGQLIVVNRQLLVANAFEDLIRERTPRFHKLVRGVYDRTGLPISKHINTKKRSNIVYYAMKPLEWLFVLTLYTFDTDPENRIAMQYTK